MTASLLTILLSLLTPALRAANIPAPDEDGKYTLEADGIKASFIPYSGAITNLWITDKTGTSRDIVLGYDTADEYANATIHANYGAVPGRYANRIANATYKLDGQRYSTEVNDSPNSTIHSGTNGWSWRVWNISQVSSDSIIFTIYDSNFSSEGMPGDVSGNITYTLSPNTWSVKIEAQALTHRTPLMLTNHAYWNLDAFANPEDDTVLTSHTLSFPFSRRMIGYDSVAQANGSILDIAQYGINDFWSSPKLIGANASAAGWNGTGGPGFGGYDNGWIVGRPSNASWRDAPLASLSSNFTGIRWDMYSNQEGVVMTSCGFMGDFLPLKQDQMGDTNNGTIPNFGCVAIEPQDWIDGINHPEWGREDKQVYGPENGTYVNEIVYQFSVDNNYSSC
ncbi:galactose mutarotase-like domain-containing protein [Xylariales sp. AK1849]|nr:galactose mutarotase-like domain-containing protein [Xylariales sp. AK1849]